MGRSRYFATPFGEALELSWVKDEKKGRKALEKIGFQTASWEGF